MTTIRVLFLLATITDCHAYPNGAPWKMCSMKIPKHHGKPPQALPSPYEIVLSQYTYEPGENITVTLRSSNSAIPFRGFVVGAHQLRGDVENVVGKFVKRPANSKGLSWYAEAENVPNCMAHNSKTDKKEISFVWQAPKKNVGNIHFVAAFAKTFATFWGNVTSKEVVSLSKTPVPPFPAELKVETPSESLDGIVESCGKNSGCILYPNHCKPKDCEIIVSFSAVSDSLLEVKMAAISPGYISLAVSDDRKMGKDFTITCTIQKGQLTPSIQNGYNPRYNNARHRIYNYTKLKVYYANETVFCGFTRPYDIQITDVKVNKENVGTFYTLAFDLKTPRYVFLARGGIFLDTDVLKKHPHDPIITTTLVDFQSKKIYFASSYHMLVQMHASFMMMAWMLMAGLGMILSGSFKDILVRKACGTRLWFQLHKGIMALTAVLTIVGLIFIFLHGWRKRSIIHGAVGLAVILVTGLQIVMGMLRPGLNSKIRLFFNWAHLTLGYGVHLLAAIAMLLAFNLPHLPLHMRKINLNPVIIWVILQVISVCIFRFLRNRFDRFPSKSSDDGSGDEMLQMGDACGSMELMLQTNEREDDFGGNEEMPGVRIRRNLVIRNRVMFGALGVYILVMGLFFAFCVSDFVIY